MNFVSIIDARIAKDNCEAARKHIRQGFVWERSPQGHHYWQGVDSRLGHIIDLADKYIQKEEAKNDAA